jgi:hypothetical protein
LSQGFYDHSRGIFDGCVVAIDGLAVITQQPFNHEVKYKKDYQYPKGGFATSLTVRIYLHDINSIRGHY